MKTKRRARPALVRAFQALNAELTGNGGTTTQGTSKWCKVCSRGIILAETKLVPDVASVISFLSTNGRGNKQPLYRRVTSYHCDRCGVIYAFPPKG